LLVLFGNKLAMLAYDEKKKWLFGMDRIWINGERGNITAYEISDVYENFYKQ
jgi:hypothetical protein